MQSDVENADDKTGRKKQENVAFPKCLSCISMLLSNKSPHLLRMCAFFINFLLPRNLFKVKERAEVNSEFRMNFQTGHQSIQTAERPTPGEPKVQAFGKLDK